MSEETRAEGKLLSWGGALFLIAYLGWISETYKRNNYDCQCNSSVSSISQPSVRTNFRNCVREYADHRWDVDSQEYLEAPSDFYFSNEINSKGHYDASFVLKEVSRVPITDDINNVRWKEFSVIYMPEKNHLRVVGEKIIQVDDYLTERLEQQQKEEEKRLNKAREDFKKGIEHLTNK